MQTQIEQHIAHLRKQADSLDTTAMVLERDAAAHREQAKQAREVADLIEQQVAK